jgi:hypothetical protein
MGGENGLGAHARSFRKDDSQIPSPVTCRRLHFSLRTQSEERSTDPLALGRYPSQNNMGRNVMKNVCAFNQLPFPLSKVRSIDLLPKTAVQ